MAMPGCETDRGTKLKLRPLIVIVIRSSVFHAPLALRAAQICVEEHCCVPRQDTTPDSAGTGAGGGDLTGIGAVQHVFHFLYGPAGVLGASIGDTERGEAGRGGKGLAWQEPRPRPC